MSLIAVVAVVVTGPVGVLTDRLGARVVLVWGHLAQLLGAVVLAFATTIPALVGAFVLLGVSFGVGWPAFNAMIASIVDGRLRTQFFGINFALVNLGIGIGGVVTGFPDRRRAALDLHRHLPGRCRLRAGADHAPARPAAPRRWTTAP